LSCLPAPSLSCTATAPTSLYTLSLHDALPILGMRTNRSQDSRTSRPKPLSSPPTTTAMGPVRSASHNVCSPAMSAPTTQSPRSRSEEHTSELQSRENLVCRLLLEKKKTHKHQR